MSRNVHYVEHLSGAKVIGKAGLPGFPPLILREPSTAKPSPASNPSLQANQPKAAPDDDDHVQQNLVDSVDDQVLRDLETTQPPECQGWGGP